MARRRKGLIDDIFDTLQQLPWYLGVIFAGVIQLVGQSIAAGAATGPMGNAIRPLMKMVFNGLSILALVAAAVSAVKSLSRRKLLDHQSGIGSLRALSWREFEQLVGEAYRRKGYHIEETGGGGADGGIDLVLRGNGETVLVQRKQWKARQVGVDKVRELFGVVMAEHADRGILVTSGDFTKEALSFHNGKPLTLVDGPKLARLVHGVQPADRPATAPAPAFVRSEPACPKCGSLMVLRTARRGATAGSQFYGCSRYPQCKGTLNK